MDSHDDLVGQEQGFLSHLVELRDRLLKMLLAVGLFFVSLFWIRDDIFSWLAAPLSRYLPEGQQLTAIDVATPFFIPFKVVLLLSVFLAIPVLFYQIWAFVAPGLYKHEKRLVSPLLFSSIFLFYVGVAFAYFVVFPLAFKFFIAVAPEGVSVQPDIARYLDFVMTIFFAFGLAFEVPVATVLVVMLGLTTPEKLIKMRPYIFVGAFIIGMFLTPPDIISQTLLAVPMWLLFEVGIIFSRSFKVRAEEAIDARDRRHDADPADTETTKPGAASEGKYRNSLTDHVDDSTDADSAGNSDNIGP